MGKEKWAVRAGRICSAYDRMDFPFVTEEQQKFGLRGYVAAYIIPDTFEPKCPGAELVYQEAGNYAKIRITDPFCEPFIRIPEGYQEIMQYIQVYSKWSDDCSIL